MRKMWLQVLPIALQVAVPVAALLQLCRAAAAMKVVWLVQLLMLALALAEYICQQQLLSPVGSLDCHYSRQQQQQQQQIMWLALTVCLLVGPVGPTV
jgi:hypothetical protein